METVERSTHMRVVDVDPDLLRRSAAAQLHAAKAGIDHVQSEMTGDVDLIVATLAAQGPYGYTIRQQLAEDGTLRVPILSTRAEIFAEYKAVRSLSDVLGHQGMIDIRGHWYLFHDVITTSQRRPDGPVNRHNTLVLCPVKGSSEGITGEIFWHRTPREGLGRGDDHALKDADRRTLLLYHYDTHETYLAALRNADVDGLAALANDSVQLAIRDYVTDSGTLTQTESRVGEERNSYRTYWRAFFDKFEILSVDMLQRAVEEWYVFAELRFTARIKRGGEKVAFNIAEFLVTARDGRFVAHIGHGTDIAPTE
jgi:hypothetical protein